MSDTAASFDDVIFYDGRDFGYGDFRTLMHGFLGSAAMGIAAAATVGAAVAVATAAGVWMVGVALSGNPHLQARAPVGPARLALVDPAAFPRSSFEAKWAPVTAAASAQARLAARMAEQRIARADRGVSAPLVAPRPHLKVKHEVAHAPALTRPMTPVATLTPPVTSVQARPPIIRAAPKPAVARIASVPLPRVRPILPKIAQAPAENPAPKVAVVMPPPVPPVEKRVAPLQAHNKGPVLPGPDSRTALYDIAGHTVYMPDGERLEAHSGLGNKIDDPRYIKVKDRGPTPPNVYDLMLRERLFHGVRAIRLTPVNGGKMFGRTGMLAHSYMLGANGQSNGCVSFKHYHRFLQAFLDGEVDRMVVVRSLDDAPPRLASLVRAPRGHGTRYAANEFSLLDPTNW